MKKLSLTLTICLIACFSFAGNILTEGFEYANHDMEKPVGWTCDDDSWLCGYLEKDHNRKPHNGNWYAFSNAEDSWMFMPIYMIESMRYRFTLWVISDGSFQFEIWAGSASRPDAMHTLILSTTFESNSYDKVSAYMETVPPDCQCFGIRAIANEGATHLTIDDVEIDMVEQYTFEAEAITGDTSMYPGTQAIFHFFIHNTGYDPVDVTVEPINEYFTDFSFYVDGVMGTTFPTQPDEIIKVTVYATLRPEVEPGSVVWLDIRMTIPCNCTSGLVTFWVTPLDPTGLKDDIVPNINIFPNPVTDFVTIETEDLQCVTVMDEMGRTIKSVPSNGNALLLDLTDLKAGTYLISAKTRSTSSLVKPILKM